MVDVLKTLWAVTPSEVGGWSIVLPNDLTPAGQLWPVADFVAEDVAIHIAQLHNDWLGKESYGEDSTHDMKEWDN